ncbi:hypothetical protein ACQEVB_13640 [Pseudonocardia sp. CA-107938]|uniref:hypothetical protein n=1 Tax=Pseudonocardia sp. CA-107938 TaxID=3240021 RepID=UPI003D933C90
MTMNTPAENHAGTGGTHLGRAAALTLPVLRPRDALGREITRVLRSGHDLGHGRGRGQDALCEAVAARLDARSGGALTGHDVVVTGGASAAPAAVATALLEVGGGAR